MYVFYELLCQTEKVFMSVLIQIKRKNFNFFKTQTVYHFLACSEIKIL